MAIELRPLRLGEILDRMFRLYRERFLLFLGIAGASTLLEAFWAVGNLGLTRQLGRSHPGPVYQALVTVTSVAGWAISFATAALAMAAINRAVLAMYEGRPTGIIAAYRELRGRWLTCIWVSIVAFFIAWSPIIVVALGTTLSIVVAVHTKALTVANTASAFYGVAVVAALIAFPLCVWLMLRYSLAIPACVQEHIGTLRSLKRSVFLSRESRFRIFLLLLVVVVAWYIPLIVLMIPTLFLIAKNRGHVPPLSVTIYTMGVSYFVNMLMKPIYGIGLTLLYLDERVRKEGYDVEWMLEHSTPPEAAAPELFPGSAPSPDNLIVG